MSYNLDINGNHPLVSEDLSVRSSIQPRTFFAFGINYKTAAVEIREKLHLRDDEIPDFLAHLRSHLTECMVLSTCNRTEIYGVTDKREIDLDELRTLLIEYKDAQGIVTHDHFFSFIACTASQQLFNVATSIDSRVIGDSQILRQLRQAYDLARQKGFTGKVLNQVMQRAFKLGKLTYTQTSIHDGAVSVSLAAVELAAQSYGSLRERTAIVIGAGEMARCTSSAFINKRIGKLLITNRTRAHAEQMAASLTRENGVECEVFDLADIREQLAQADIVVSSTASEDPILYARDFESVERDILVVDIAVPRDIDPGVGELPNVALRNIDDLRSIIDRHYERRVQDLPKVKSMVTDEMVDFLTWYYTLHIMPEFEKTGVKPPVEQTYEILRVKQFFDQNLSEIHRLAAASSGDFHEDLASHLALIDRLQSLKAQAFASSAA
jgi:glutamyl-tRNA reductase